MTASEGGTNAKAKSASTVPAVAKALDIFEALGRAPRGLTIAQIADATGRTLGEIYRVAVYLAERGYLEKTPETDRYVLTLRMFQLASTNAPASQLVRLAVPELESLAYRTEQSCHLATLSDSNILVLVSESSPRHAGFAIRTGASIPLSDTSSGAVILAFSSDNVRERHMAAMLPSERREWRDRMEAIRQTGFIEQQSALVHGVTNLCAPVFDPRGIVASLAIGFVGQINQRTGIREARILLQDHASRLTRLLGGEMPAFPVLPIPSD